jgi:hypothetical protein
MPAKATKKAWEALKPKLGADKIWRDSHIGDSLSTWEKHYTFCEAEAKKIGAHGQVSNIGPTLTIMTKFHVELPKSMQAVHDKLNSITHKATRQRVQAFKALINQDFTQVDTWHKAEQHADAARKAAPPRPPAPPLQQPQHGVMQQPIPVPPPTPMGRAKPPAPPPQGAKPRAMAGTAPDRGPPPPVPPFNRRPSGQK